MPILALCSFLFEAIVSVIKVRSVSMLDEVSHLHGIRLLLFPPVMK